MLSLFNLEYTGLLKRKSGNEKGTWEGVSKILQLQEENIDEESPTSTSFVFSGLKPLSVTIVEKFLDKWSELKNVMPFHEIGEKKQIDLKNEVSDRKLMVFFVGGVTHAEISALRYLAKVKNFSGGNILIGTTKLITGSSLLTTMLDEPEIE
jgi:vacuolar protein sorting-associated protein 33A